MRGRGTALIALVVVAAAVPVATASGDTIRLQSTTDIKDSGQYDNVFVNNYAIAQPGDTLSASFVGTGAAINNAKAGLADVVITHAPSLEAGFVNPTPGPSYSKESHGRAIFYNDYVIVGPKTDPANVLGLAPHDAVLALQTIAARGAGASHDVTFVSRGDNSGTNVQEQILWGLSSVSPKKLACNGAGDPNRYEPGTACPGGYPAWYKQSGLGQGANLTSANTCSTSSYPQGGCYTMLDRGTWIHNQTAASNMMIVSSDNSPTAIGGQTLQTNYFHAYVVSAARAPYPNGTTPNEAAGQRFVNWLASPDAQNKISIYPNTTTPAGTGDSVAKASYTVSPTHGSPGTSLTITTTLKYGAPPNEVLPSYPNVQLQQCVGPGCTFSDVSGKVGTTNASGVVTFTGVTLGASSTKYRVRMPDYDNSTASIFTLFTAGAALDQKNVPVP
jgi:tungstate transport system substrate-binding protein